MPDVSETAAGIPKLTKLTAFLAQRRRVSGRRLRAAARLRRDEKGSAAVEFAIVAPLFFFLMFVIAETALVFIAEQVMDNAVFETARLVRTGQAQNMTKADFTEEVCDRMSVFIDCSGDGFYLDVRSYPNCPSEGGEPCGFAAMETSPPVDEEEEFEEAGEFEFGTESEIVVMRAYYQWPTNKIFWGLSLENMANGKRLIGSFAAFRNEPFGEIAQAE